MKKTSEKGFTLIELLVVIFIIGILTALILPNFVSSRERARDAKRKQELSQIKTALRLYYNDNQAYPDSGDVPFGLSWSPYMTQVPQDPLNQDPYVYSYTQTDSGEGFFLMATMENNSDPEIDGSKARCGISGDSSPHFYICAN